MDAVIGNSSDECAAARRLLARGPRAHWWRRCGDKQSGFWYVDSRGTPITDAARLKRVEALAIPPGYAEVRVAPEARSRLQAICLDASGRVQYRYHADFAACQAAHKYEKIVRFGENLPKLRRVINEHISGEGLGRDRVLAVVVRLIGELYFRLGSEASVERYQTFGITTLRSRHLRSTRDGQLVFSYVAKHHIPQRRMLTDTELADVIRQIKGIRGPRLFSYLDDIGRVHPVTGQDVNHYIKAAMGAEFSAKDFRTWGGTLIAAVTLAELGRPSSECQARKNIVQAAKAVAERLGNTPAVCRACYIHPAVFTRYSEGITLDDFRPLRGRRITRLHAEQDIEELELLKLLKTNLR